ncbi:MAG TPA: extracellular solute-binding protein [Nakamurella sp.]|jgi:glucose/mannose transport system substrate-binding protein|nr:extracellular solute-binding protein [Nakamurella sp.]
MRRTLLIASLAVAGLLAAACGSNGSADNPSGTSGGGGGASGSPSGAASGSAGSGSSGTGSAGGAGGDVGIFTWWADGSEKEGLDALVKIFNEKYPNDKFVNLAVAGGAGSNAKAKLAADLQAGNPPDSFQGHAGAELTDYINNGQIEPLDDLYAAEGWNDVFPKDLLARLTVDGHIYSVPSNIHRANVVWANNEVLTKAGLDPKSPPKDIKSWISDMDKIKASGVSTPLTIGGTWTQVELLETVLISDLGADGYNGLFDGKTKWDDAKVTTALNDYKTLLTYANTAADGDDWPGAIDAVIDGKAAYNVMGDWAVAEFNAKNKKDGEDYSYFAVPGQEGVYDFLADSFTLPKGAKNPEGTKDWLRTVGSADGQKAFNLAKGSIPARTDVAADGFPPYQQWAMDEFKKDTIVSSIAHGAAVSLGWNTDISNAVSQFYGSRDVAQLQQQLVQAAQNNMNG